MHQKLKRVNRKRLASLSALGAGALGVAAIPADANDIVFSGVINVQIPSPVYKYTMLGPDGAGGIFKYSYGECQVTCFHISAWAAVALSSKPGKFGTEFRFLATGPRNSFAQGEPLAAIWGTAAGKSTKSADIWYAYSFHGIETTFSPTDRYLLFRFQGGALKHDMYGWARIQVTTKGEVDLVDWAYDSSGAQIPAGDTGTPEPSTFALTGLAALALGAKGLRAWCEARKKAAAA